MGVRFCLFERQLLGYLRDRRESISDLPILRTLIDSFNHRESVMDTKMIESDAVDRAQKQIMEQTTKLRTMTYRQRDTRLRTLLHLVVDGN